VERAEFTELFSALLDQGQADEQEITDRPRVQTVGGLNDHDVVGITELEHHAAFAGRPGAWLRQLSRH
jgi:hypothetical protein